MLNSFNIFAALNLDQLWERISHVPGRLILHHSLFSFLFHFLFDERKYYIYIYLICFFCVLFWGRRKGMKISTQQYEWLTQTLVNQQNVRMNQMMVCVCVHILSVAVVVRWACIRRIYNYTVRSEESLQFHGQRGKNSNLYLRKASWFVHKIYLPI